MKNLILSFLAVITLTGCSNTASTESSERPKTPEELKMELASQEKTDPLTYLSIDATMREDQVLTREEGLFHSAEYSPDGNTIHGTIKNTATIAKFKDVVLRVTFYSQTETAIESKDYVVYEFYSPNTSTDFNLKVYPPEAMAKFGIEIVDAKAAD